MQIDFTPLFHSAPGKGWLDMEEALLMFDYAMQTEGDILEVGSYCGRSTCILAALGRTVYAVDPFDNFDSDLTGDQIEKIFLSNLQNRGIGNVKLFRQKIEDWEPRPCGFVFLDGDHTYQGTISQIEKALICKPRFIAVHDVNNSGEGAEVKRACELLLGQFIIRAGKMAIYSL